MAAQTCKWRVCRPASLRGRLPNPLGAANFSLGGSALARSRPVAPFGEEKGLVGRAPGLRLAPKS